jgi:hypothetical protein
MSTGLQVVLGLAGVAMIGLAIVFVSVLFALRRQVDRIVTAMEHAEAEITPLAREARIVFYRVGNLTDQTQRIVEGASSVVLPPVIAARRAIDIVRAGASAFVTTLVSGKPRVSKA